MNAAKPTTRIYDIANALFWLAPLLHPSDRAPAFAHHFPRRIALFADVYAMTGRQRADLVPFASRMVQRFQLTGRAADDVDPVFRRLWEEGKDRPPQAQAWLAQADPEIAARLAQRSA